MMNNYDIVINTAYLDECTNDKKHGMYPTFDILNAYSAYHSHTSILPTNSAIITALMEFFTRSEIENYFASTFGYMNCCIPLSERYSTLTSVLNRIKIMWNNHDIANLEKFTRLIETVTDNTEISPLYKYHKKWDSDETRTPNLTNTETKTGTEALAKANTETLSGSDTINSQGSSTESTVNGVTSFDQSTNFYNNDNSATNSQDTDNKTVSYGKSISDNGTDTTTYNTNTQNKTTGNDKNIGSGNEWYTDLSLAEIQARELAMNTILDLYFTSVLRHIGLATLEEIW